MRVSEAELDSAFDDVERADRNLTADLGFIGVVTGAAVSQHSPVPDLTVDVSGPAAIYNQLGERIFFSSLQNVNVAVDANGVSTAVAVAGEEKIVSVFAQFDRAFADPRIDGNSLTVFFQRDESFRFLVAQGAPAAAGSALPPPLRADAILLADITRTSGQTQVLNSDIAIARRQDAVVASGEPRSIQTGQTREAIADLLTFLNAHTAGTADRHSALAIEYLGGNPWRDGTPNPPTSAHHQLDKIIGDLTATTGSSKIGTTASISGTPNLLTAGSVRSQLDELLIFINAHANQLANAHAAAAIVTAGSPAWLGGRANPPTTVEAQLDKIVSDLGAQSVDDDGAERIGAQAVAGTPNNLGVGSVRGQLSQLLGHVNAAARPNLAQTWTATQQLDGPAGEENPSLTTVINPTNRKLLWAVTGGGYGLRFYYTDTTLEITLNARWDGTQWIKDNSGIAAARFLNSNSVMRWQLHTAAVASFTTDQWGGSSSRQFVFDVDGMGNGQTLTLGREYVSPSGPLTGISAATDTNGSFAGTPLAGGSSFAGGRLPSGPSSVTFTIFSQTNTESSPTAFIALSTGVAWLDSTVGTPPYVASLFLSFSAV